MMTTPSARAPGAVAALLVTLAIAPAAAGDGAQVRVDRSCYLNGAPPLTLSGNGFVPGQAYAVILDGVQPSGGSGTVDATGAVSQQTPVPVLDKGAETKSYAIGVVSGSSAASTHFGVTRFDADFEPPSGDPATLKVRFAVHGFALVKRSPTVYLHYVSPAGKLKRTIALGTAQGACGTLELHHKRKLFPFTPAHGRWYLQFDTAKAYRHGTGKSSFLFASLGVNVHAR